MERLDLDIVLEYLFWYIGLPSIKYKGFILDGFPGDSEQAKSLLEKMVQNGVYSKFDAILYLRPDYLRMSEEIKRHQKLGHKDST